MTQLNCLDGKAVAGGQWLVVSGQWSFPAYCRLPTAAFTLPLPSEKQSSVASGQVVFPCP